jgi:hypothetical protein
VSLALHSCTTEECTQQRTAAHLVRFLAHRLQLGGELGNPALQPPLLLPRRRPRSLQLRLQLACPALRRRLRLCQLSLEV